MIHRLLAPWSEFAYALLRLGAGLMFSFHGLQKIFGILRDHQPEVGTQLWWGGLIELLCGVAVALGFRTSWAAFLASGTMAVAYTQFHWKMRGGIQLLPAINEGELALLYALVFFFIACRGGGRLSLERH